MPRIDAQSTDTVAIKHMLRDVKKARKRTSFREWCDGRFSWFQEITAEPILFYLLTFTGVLFSLGGGLFVFRIFTSPLFASLLILLPITVFIWYRIEAARKEANVNAELDNQINQLKATLFEIAQGKDEQRRIRYEEIAVVRRQAAQQRRARHRAREKQFGSLSTRYLVIWLAGGAIAFGVFGCVIDPLYAAILGGVGVLVTLFGWSLGRLDLKSNVDWREKWEQCPSPSCHLPGAGKLYDVEQLGQRTTEEMRTAIDAVYRDGVKEAEIHRQMPTSSTVVTEGLFYECRCCGHRWVKVEDFNTLPLFYMNEVIALRQNKVTRAKHQLEQLWEDILNPPEPPHS